MTATSEMPGAAHGMHPLHTAHLDSHDRLHGGGPQLSWNAFRYVGDYLHLIGVAILFFTIVRRGGSVRGLSYRTQAMYMAVFYTRYLDLAWHHSSLYLVLFKAFYLSTSTLAVVLFHKLSRTYEATKDTFNAVAVAIGCTGAALLATKTYSVAEILWTWSEFAEGFAMVPQYVFCYRDSQFGSSNSDAGVVLFVVCHGIYRTFYAMNWIYKRAHSAEYWDVSSWMGGVIEIAFFADFLAYRLANQSLLRSAVLQADDKLNDVSKKVEMAVVPKALRRKQRDGDTVGNLRRRPNGLGFEDVIDV